MKILITGGGTSERIDDVRFITNFSTGKTSHQISDFFSKKNYEVTYIHSFKSEPSVYAKKNIEFISSDDLEKKLFQELSKNHYDIVFHSSAVSDFYVDKVVINGELFDTRNLKKLSSKDDIELVLKTRPKIIHKLKTFSMNPQIIIVGFKLTNAREPEDRKHEVFDLSMRETVDFVVHNDLSEIDSSRHITHIYFKDTVLFQGQTKDDLCKNLDRILLLIHENKLSSNGIYT